MARATVADVDPCLAGFVLDKVDSSVTRSDEYFRDLFRQAEIHVYKHRVCCGTSVLGDSYHRIECKRTVIRNSYISYDWKLETTL